jgi:hypothetical protein
MFFARKKANEFANRVYDEFTKKEEQKAGRADVLEGMAAAEGLKVEITPPFDRDEGPDEPESDLCRHAFGRRFRRRVRLRSSRSKAKEAFMSWRSRM